MPDAVVVSPSSYKSRATSSKSQTPRPASPSSSEYSCDSDTGNPQQSHRRAGYRSDVASDRRRLAIVQMETVKEGRSKSVSDDGHNSSSRRLAEPNLTGLAIVAPPDASPSTYTHLSPPVTATGVDHAKSTSRSKHRARTAPRPASQPSNNYATTSQPQATGNEEPHQHLSRASKTPSLIICSSASSSSLNLHSPSVDQPLITPPIGQSKDIHAPVAGPVVVNLGPSRPLNILKGRTKPNNEQPPPITGQVSSDSSSKRGDIPYVQYQPGLHATAGPLPPPPRATFTIDPSNPPPPRPPRMPHTPRGGRDIEAVKQALQLPPSVSAALASRSARSPPQSSIEEVTEAVKAKHSHRREGAFVPTPDLASEQKIPSSLVPQLADQKLPESDASEGSLKNKSEPESGTPDSGERTIIVAPPPRVDSLHAGHEPSHVQREVASSPEPVSQIPSPPPKSFRNSLTTGLKRFSPLPRTPSASSRSANRSSIGTIRTSRTPSPSCQQETASQPSPPRHKVITQNPPALFCHEVHSSKSASERCSIYARKINELYNCDTGLVMWLYEAKYRGTNNSSSVPTSVASAPTTDPFSPQRRHTSGSSMMTEATFPRRPDATSATDLTSTNRNITPPSIQPPTLPYPSLATPQPQRLAPSTPTSIRSFASSTPTGSFKSALFSSLGRRSSTSGRREKPGITTLTPTNSLNSGGNGRTANVLTKPQPSPRPVNVTTSPSVPGGPRAPPNRVKRSQTLMATPAPFSTKHDAERTEQQSGHKHFIDINPDPEFIRQVDKLADLLPHADRHVLAAYLRRSGQDILAIGQYLDDEKNGTIHTD